MILFIIILIVVIAILIFVFMRSKHFKFDSVVMTNGNVGSGKTSTNVYLAIKAHKKAHGIWYRRTHWYSKFFPLLRTEEEPLLYSNIPLFKNRKKLELYPYYVPLTNDLLVRKKRFNYKSIILLDETSLIANSQDYKDKILSQSLTEFTKLIRHELKGCYRNIFGGYANIYCTTQSKNDNHFAFDRVLNQVLYITKSINIPFFRIVWCRELLLIDSVVNNFEDDFKESMSSRWYLIPKKVFNFYNSYAYSFLTDDLIVENKTKTIFKLIDGREKFEIPTFHTWKDISESNNYLYDLANKEKEKEKKEFKEVDSNGE